MTRQSVPFVNDVAPARYPSPWGGATGRRYRVLCSDGIVRTATATAEPDTLDTIPARVNVNGRTVAGHVYHRGNLDFRTAGWPEFDDSTPLYRFTAYSYRKNGDALPEWGAMACSDAPMTD